jgi:hypothetical protein
LDDTKIVKAIVDRGVKGSKIDLLVCHPDVWVTYGDFLSSSKQLSPTMELPGGWTALSVSGTPLVMDRFSKKQSIFGFETKQWTEHMLHDWEFQDDGMFQRVHGTANFEVLMTKYSELICDKPSSSFEMPLITVV